MSKLSEEISKVFGFRIQEGKWKTYLSELDLEGEPTRRHISEILFILCEELEKADKKLEETAKLGFGGLNAQQELEGGGLKDVKTSDAG